MRLFYVIGIALNGVAFTASVLEGELLFAITFLFVMVYLGIRYAMVVRD